MAEDSSPAQRKLEEAALRLLDGKPIRTNGDLTKTNLYMEAGVSRATMNRAREVLASWDSKVAQIRAGGDGPATPATLTDRQRTDLAELRRQLKVANEQLHAAKTIIAAIHADNRSLREQIHSRSRRPMVPINDSASPWPGDR